MMSWVTRPDCIYADLMQEERTALVEGSRDAQTMHFRESAPKSRCCDDCKTAADLQIPDIAKVIEAASQLLTLRRRPQRR